MTPDFNQDTESVTVVTPWRVRYFETDQQSVVFNMWYPAYFEDIRNAYLERDEPPAPEEPTPEIVLRWWKLMEPHMECNPDGSPYHEPVEEMFHFEQQRGS